MKPMNMRCRVLFWLHTRAGSLQARVFLLRRRGLYRTFLESSVWMLAAYLVGQAIRGLITGSLQGGHAWW